MDTGFYCQLQEGFPGVFYAPNVLGSGCSLYSAAAAAVNTNANAQWVLDVANSGQSTILMNRLQGMLPCLVDSQQYGLCAKQ